MSRKMRRAGWIPGVLYGGNGGKQLLKVPRKTIMAELRARPRSFENSVYDVVIGDETHVAIPRQVARHPVTDDVLSVNFLRFKAGTNVRVPFRYVNEELSSAIKRGAYVLEVSSSLNCAVLTEDIPAELEVDLTGVVPKEVIRLSRVAVPDSVEVLDTDPNFVIATIVGKRLSK